MITRVSYDKWFLNNLENVQKTLNTRQAARQQRAAEKADNYRRFDTVEFTDEAYKALEASRERTFEKSASAEKIAKPAKAEFDGFDLMKLIQASTAEKGQPTDNSGVGLLDLIDSGTIDYEEIKPVQRDFSEAYSDDDVVASAISLPAEITAAPKSTEASAPRGESLKLSEPISRKEDYYRENDVARYDYETSEMSLSESRLTAAQQKGVETYQRIQSYTNPYVMSMNMAHSVA